MSTAEVHVFDDVAVQAARRFVQVCTALLRERSRIHVGLSGGETARDFYQGLARPESRAGLDVRAIHFYQGDERPVPPSSPESNWGLAATTFLDPAGVPEENRQRMSAESADLDQAACEYEERLRGLLPLAGLTPSFDLLLLGMGADGHTASLFSGTRALNETVRLVVANPVPDLQVTRLTITTTLINAARAVWIIVSGARKAQTVRRALELRDPGLPVTRVTPHQGPLVWLLDRAAAGALSPGFLRKSAQNKEGR